MFIQAPLTGSTLLPEAEVVEEYDAATGQRTAWALNFGATRAHEVGYSYTETGLLGSVTLIEDAEPLAHWAHDYAPAMARVGRVQGRLGAAGLLHTATSFFDEHLRVEQMAHFAGTQLRQGWSYQFDPQRPQRRVGRTDMVAERPGWAWGYNGRGEVTSAQRIQSVAGAAPVAGQGWGYGYDAIGNRLQATRSTAQVAVIDFAPDGGKDSESIRLTSAVSPDFVAMCDLDLKVDGADRVVLLGGSRFWSGDHELGGRRLGGFQPLGVEGAWKAPFLGGGEGMAWDGKARRFSTAWG